MPKYTFVSEGTISLSCTVEAEDLETATELAKEAPVMSLSLCHQCARGDDGEWVTSGELDCDPTTAPLSEVWEDDESIPTSDVEW